MKQMIRILFILLLAALFALSCAGAEGTPVKAGDYEYVLLEDGTAAIVAYPVSNKRIEIPSTIDGIPVSEVRKYTKLGWKDQLSLKYVTIGEGVRVIGERAFSDMKRLVSVKMPSTLEVIGDGAFDSSGLMSAELPESLKTIGNRAFRMTRMKEITIPAGVAEIGEDAFAGGDTQITKIVFLGAYPRIGACPFGGMTLNETRKGFYTHDISGNFMNVPEIRVFCLPGSTADELFQYKVIKQYLSWGQEGIRTAPAGKKLEAGLYTPEDGVYELVIPEGVEEIADGAFKDLKTLYKVTLPSTLKRIGKEAFAGNPALQKIALPDKLEAIGEGCFADCKALSSVTLPEGVAAIPDRAFSGCINLQKLVVPNSVAEIGEGVLDGHTDKLQVTCGRGSAMETWLASNAPDVKVNRKK